MQRHELVGGHVGRHGRRLDIEECVVPAVVAQGHVVEVHVAAHVHLQTGLGQGAGGVFRGAADHLHLVRAQQRLDVVRRAVEELRHREVAECDDLLALRLAAGHDVGQPLDDVALVGEHLVIALIAGAGEVVRAGTGRHIDVGVQANQPHALHGFDHVGRVGHHLAQGVVLRLVRAAGAFGADLVLAIRPIGLRQCGRVVVVFVLVGAVRSFVVQVLRLGHEAVPLQYAGDPGVAHVQHFLGAIRISYAGPVAAVGRGARVGAAAVDRLGKADHARHGVQSQIVALAGRLVEWAVGIMVARRGEELDAVLLRILVHYLDQAAHVHGLAVIREIARQRDVFHAALHGVVQRGEEGEVVFVEQARGCQLRIHRPDGGVVAGLRIGDARERAILEIGVDVMEVDVGHERDLHGGGRLGGRLRRRGRFGYRGLVVVLVAAAGGEQGNKKHGAGGSGVA
ncbi:hypothetical protein D3C72_1124160 [compost metagenome]